MATLADMGLIYRGIKPLKRLGAQARGLVVSGWADTLETPLLRRREEVPQRLLVVPPDPWAGDAQRGRDMIAGVFRLGGQSIARENLSWEPLGASRDWLYDLHSFEFLRDLRSVGGDRARRMARDMVGSWMARYTRLAGPTAAADVIGVRLANWISFHDFFCASADDAFREAYFISLVRQAGFLQRLVPGGLSGLPLLRALKGLAYSGLTLEGGEGRLEAALRLIAREAKAQILPDGCHVSRSPQATFTTLQILVDLRMALSAARLPVPRDIQRAIERLVPAVRFFRHGCGALALFNGGQEGNAHICDATLMHAGARGRAIKNLPYGGYEKMYRGRAQVLMDVAAPSTASSRAHAGLASFEYSYGKDRVFVNCGTAASDGAWRESLRATAAHNALVLDCRNNMQMDDRGALLEKIEATCRRGDDSAAAFLEVAHTGYRSRFGLLYRRRLSLADQGDILAGQDILQGRAGVPYCVHFHLHPNIHASLVNEGAEVLLRARSGTGWRFRVPEGSLLSIEDSVYCGEGVSPRRTFQIVISGETQTALTVLDWSLSREKRAR